MPAPSRPIALLAGQFTGTGPAAQAVELTGPCNFSLSGGFAATVALERSFDNGATWLPFARDAAGNPASYSAPASFVFDAGPESGVLYRPNCTAFTSGIAIYRLSR